MEIVDAKKSWKKKTESVALASIVGLTATVVGSVSSPAPAEAVQTDYHMCYIENLAVETTSGYQLLYFKAKAGCGEHYIDWDALSGTDNLGTTNGRTPVESNCFAFTEWKEITGAKDNNICEEISHIEDTWIYETLAEPENLFPLAELREIAAA